MAQKPPLVLVLGAFAAVYLIWGSTYLAIRWGIETLPPLLMASARWILPGAILYGILRLRGAEAPTRTHWATAAVVGMGLIVGGNGAVTIAELWIPSGMTALVISTVPLWMVLIDWARPRGVRPTLQTGVGLLLGIAGIVLLLQPGKTPLDPRGIALVLGACLSWAFGSIYSRNAVRHPSVLLGVAMQMLVGGAVLLVLGLAAGEASAFEPAAVSTRSLLSFLFLAFFGSIAAYSAYLWLLQVTTPARAGTYAFVNPIVAVALGWALADEVFTSETLVASALILAGVATILWQKARATPAAPASAKA